MGYVGYADHSLPLCSNIAPDSNPQAIRTILDMNSGAIISSIGGLMVGALGTYIGFYVRGALARREQVAKSLANFYASAATVYYAAKDYQRTPETNPDRMTFYKLFDQHYREFLSSSTLLASLVPPVLREEVLEVEDVWDKIGDEGFGAVSGKKWFDLLDAVRYRILDSIAYNRLIDPFWRS